MIIHLLTGPIHSGKTTRLSSWAAGRADVGGILSPLLTDGRTFVDIRSGAAFPMEVGHTAPAAMRVGRYAFAPEAFVWAADRLLTNSARPGVSWLVVDEIGPLELRGEGFDTVVHTLLSADRTNLNLLLVVREGLTEAVIKHYDLQRFPLQEFAE